MSKATKAQLVERDEARATLRELIDRSPKRRDGSPVVYCVLRHVSASGMSRDISLKTVDERGELRDITYTAALAIGEKPKDRHGQRVIRVNGCGMDMGFHLVYCVSHALYKGQDRAGYVISHEWA